MKTATTIEGDGSNRTEAESTSETEQSSALAEENPEADVLDLDDVFHILQNERRRSVLRYLKDVDDDVIEMRDMAVQIAAWENDTTVQQLYSDQRQRVYIALYQSHLPKLDKLGLINYNKPRGYVEPKPLLDDVLAYLDPEPVSDSPATEPSRARASNEHAVFFGTTGVATLLVAAGALGMTPAVLSGIGIAATVLLLYVATITYTHGSDLGSMLASEN